jgi:hypothetical protein
MRYVVCRLGALALVLSTSVPAFADDKVDCEYLEISATNGKARAIDAELKPLEKKLTRPPLSSWNVFHKLSGGHVTLARLKPEALKLSQGSATLLLRDHTEKRVELTITIDGSDGKRVLETKQSVNPGDWNAWGHNVKDDGHILALTCK